MILCYTDNPHGNDGVKNPSGRYNIYRVICDRCYRKEDVLTKAKIPKLAKDVTFPKRWKVYNENSLMERHICRDCTNKGLN